MKKIVLIGSTGSIGRQVLNVGRALASTQKQKALDFASLPEADIIFNAAGGFAGLNYSLNAVKAGKTLALANKETLVCGGDIITPLARKNGVEIAPVDSEHSAIWQCLNFRKDTPVRRLIITASGGAFADLPYSELKGVTPERALAHPTWKMGKKITVDCATLMNKGYEVFAHRYGNSAAEHNSLDGGIFGRRRSRADELSHYGSAHSARAELSRTA